MSKDSYTYFVYILGVFKSRAFFGEIARIGDGRAEASCTKNAQLRDDDEKWHPLGPTMPRTARQSRRRNREPALKDLWLMSSPSLPEGMPSREECRAVRNAEPRSRAVRNAEP